MQPNRPKLLVLDGQGVVFDAPVKEFLRSFALHNGLDFTLVKKRWKNEVRRLAWSGAIDDATIWNKLACREVDCEKIMRDHDTSYAPGPAATRLSDWSKQLPIWMLSNHRLQWVLPHLDRSGLTPKFQELLISDQTGFVKPDLTAYEQLFTDGMHPGDILFVDDKPRNTRAAESLGVRTVLASPKNAWVAEIDTILGN